MDNTQHLAATLTFGASQHFDLKLVRAELEIAGQQHGIRQVQVVAVPRKGFDLLPCTAVDAPADAPGIGTADRPQTDARAFKSHGKGAGGPAHGLSI